MLAVHLDASVGAHLHLRGLKTGQSLRAGRVINCTGPRSDLDRLATPLFADLARRRLIRPDPLGLGLESDESILRQFYLGVGLRPGGKGNGKPGYTLTLPPSVLEPERLKDRQSRGRRESYPIFAGISLREKEIAKLDRGESLDVEVTAAELERAFFIADVVDLDTGEVVFEANELVPEDLGERIEGRNLTPLEVKTILHRLLRKYRLELPHKGYTTEWDYGGMPVPKDGMHIVLRPLR